MTRGFYTLGSSMLKQNHMLSAISNNIANVNTPGFKKGTILTTTFGKMVMSRVDQRKTDLGETTMNIIDDEAATVHSQGTLKQSERALDFALAGQGFFAVQSDKGIVYTRNGSFNIDNEGYLSLDGVGRVMGKNGPMQIKTDNITADQKGNIYGATGIQIDKFAIYDFKNYDSLTTVDEGMYSGTNADLIDNPVIKSKTIEGSNVEIGKEMSTSIATQRTLQNIAQTFKIYDRTLESAMTQIAKV